MSDTLPVFAVVGRVNKGKSSIVATLVEEEDPRAIAISHEAGTTTECRQYRVEVDGDALFAVVDTPGFEDAPRMLEWLRERETSAASRPDAIRLFIEHFSERDEFSEECRLLEPVCEGAGILYVVDASRPYRPNYEAEMEILQWTGRPRLALINTIGSGDHVEEWRRALGQYFNIVRVFDAHDSRFDDRIALLRAFREIDPDCAPSIVRVIEVLEADWLRRRAAAASVIGDLLVAGLTQVERLTLTDERELKAQTDIGLERLHQQLRKLERKTREAVEELYQHGRVIRHEVDLEKPVFERDLFAETNWNVLGLDTWQLIRAGAIGGAAVGATVDIATGGASLLGGSVLGAVIGSASAFFGGKQAAQVRVLGQSLGGQVLCVGPVRNPNFPWVILDRALLHYASISDRAHARRDPLELEQRGSLEEPERLVAELGAGTRGTLSSLFEQIGKSGEVVPSELRRKLTDELEAVLEWVGKRETVPPQRDAPVPSQTS